MTRNTWHAAILASLTAFAIAPAAQAGDLVIHDSRFVYDNGDKLDGFLDTWLAANAPHLVEHREVLAHWSAFYTVNPRIALTLLELRSGLVSEQMPISREDLSARLQQMLGALSREFYRHDRGGSKAGSAALNSVIGAQAPAFLPTFQRLFPGRPALILPRRGTRRGGAPPPDLLGLPYPEGESWTHGGAHTYTGSDPGPMSSLDYSPTWPDWGDDTSTHLVAAQNDGTVVVHSSCNLEVIHPSGWSTSYYHLDGIVVADGAQVARNDILSAIASDQAQALCQGGWSTGPHVHASVLQFGSYFDLQDVQLSNYRVDVGRYSYDWDCAEFYLERAGSIYCAWSPLLNDGGLVEFQLQIVNALLEAGEPLTLEAHNAPPGSQVAFIVSARGAGSSPCLPGGIACGDLEAPKILSIEIADPNGYASLTSSVPAGTEGRTASFQAGWYDATVPDGAFSMVEVRTVEP